MMDELYSKGNSIKQPGFMYKTFEAFTTNKKNEKVLKKGILNILAKIIRWNKFPERYGLWYTKRFIKKYWFW